MHPTEDFERHVTRRTFLGGAAGTLGSAALGSLLAGQARQLAAANGGEGSLGLPHFAPKAKRGLCLDSQLVNVFISIPTPSVFWM